VPLSVAPDARCQPGVLFDLPGVLFDLPGAPSICRARYPSALRERAADAAQMGFSAT
jgi:hypothetical protein